MVQYHLRALEVNCFLLFGVFRHVFCVWRDRQWSFSGIWKEQYLYFLEWKMIIHYNVFSSSWCHKNNMKETGHHAEQGLNSLGQEPSLFKCRHCLQHGGWCVPEIIKHSIRKNVIIVTKACVMRFAKKSLIFLGLYMQNIQQLAVCCLETHFGPYALTYFSFFRVLRSMIGRALWQPYSFFWCVEHTDTINPMELKDTARHVQYPSTRVAKMGVTQQEAGKPPDTFGKWCNSPFSGGNSLLNPSSNELLAWSWS